MHGIKTINHLMRTDEAMVSDIHEIRRRLQTRVMLREAFEQSQVAA
jgi:hypothetical protein